MILALAACAPRAPACEADADPDVTTVVNVTCSVPGGGPARASFGEDVGYGLDTPAQEGEHVAFALVGMPADTDVHWRVRAGDEVGAPETTGVTRTGSLPGGLPQVELTLDAGDGAYGSPRFFLGTTYSLMAESYLLAFDRRGRVVWYLEPAEGLVSIDVQLARDGRGVTFNLFGDDYSEDTGRLRTVGFGGDDLGEVRTPLGHHMFVQMPDGAVAYLAVDARTWTDPDDGEVYDVYGDAIAEIPADGGDPTTLYSVWDWIDVAWNDRMDGFSIYDGLDWTHANALKYDADTGRYLVSLGHLGQVVEVDRASGEPVRTLGLPDYTVTEGEGLYFQHDPTLKSDGRLVAFSTDPATDLVGGVEYAVDDVARTMTPTWRYTSERTSLYLGQVFRMDGGHTLLNLGQAGVLRELDADDLPVWELQSEVANGFAQFQPLDSFYVGP